MPELSLMDHHCLSPWLQGNTGAPRWCVAFSGGPDSTVLLHLLHTWCTAHPGLAPPLVALHVNHGLQSEADDWQLHCESFCKSLNVPIIISRAAVEQAGQGVEAAARLARYAVFEHELARGDILFMGHHLDDQVETYFLRLLRGSGLSGLSAMPAQRPLGAGTLIRPLMTRPRAELEAYHEVHKLESIDDPSNADISIDRNYLRQQVLPLLSRRWEGYRQTVVRAADHAAVSQAVIDECLPAPKTIFSVMGDPGVQQSGLNRVSPDAAMIKLRHWLRVGGYPMPDQRLLAEFIRQLREGARASSPRLECSRYVLQRYQGGVYLLPEVCRQEQPARSAAAVPITPGEKRHIAGVGTLALEPLGQGEGLVLDQADQLELRWRLGGERCRPRGRPYNQRLKKLFQEFGVPPWWRERIPLLYLGNELLAAGDLWLCESSRLAASPSTGSRLWQLSWERKPSAFD